MKEIELKTSMGSCTKQGVKCKKGPNRVGCGSTPTSGRG